MHYFISVVRDKFADFNGRARRAEYWYFVLFSTLISYALTALDFGMGLTFGSEMSPSGILSTIYSLVILIPSIAVGVRRMHDVGKSGWYLLIPIYNFILAVTEGDPHTNEYGPDPKNPASDEDDIMAHLVD